MPERYGGATMSAAHGVTHGRRDTIRCSVSQRMQNFNLALLQSWDNNNYFDVVYEIENELITGADIAYLSVRGGPCQLRTGGPRAAPNSPEEVREPTRVIGQTNLGGRDRKRGLRGADHDVTTRHDVARAAPHAALDRGDHGDRASSDLVEKHHERIVTT